MKDFLRYIVRYSTRIYEFVLILSFALICFFPSIATKEYIMYLIFIRGIFIEHLGGIKANKYLVRKTKKK